ncbi:hypothetical protein PIB30_040015, partial [Stylosanthes scabra]|nr:hypothetical protein [Stylosanthes scabra]
SCSELKWEPIGWKTIAVTETKYRRFGKICDSDKAKEHSVQGVGNFLNKEVTNISENKFGRCYKSVLLEENKEGDFIGPNFGKFDEDSSQQSIVKGTVDQESLLEVKPMGCFKMVLTFDSLENKVEALNSPFLLNYFDEVRDWSENEANRPRVARIEICGMPLEAWSRENFNSVAQVCGSVLEIEEHGLLGDRYNSVRAIIDTNWLHYINDVVNFDLNGTIYEVFVREISAIEDYPRRKNKAIAEDEKMQGVLEVVAPLKSSTATKCLFDDRDSLEVIQATQLGVKDCPTFNDVKDGNDLQEMESFSGPVLPPGFEEFVQDICNIPKAQNEETRDADENKVIAQNHDNVNSVIKEVESLNSGDNDIEDLEEDRRTLNLCQKGGLSFEEDEDVVLATLRKKKRNKGKDFYNNSKGNKMGNKSYPFGLKLSKRLIT